MMREVAVDDGRVVTLPTPAPAPPRDDAGVEDAVALFGSHHPDNHLRPWWRNDPLVDAERERIAETQHDIRAGLRENPAAFSGLTTTPTALGLDRLCDAVVYTVLRAARQRIAAVEGERLALAKLAAETPQFFSPLDAFAAQAIRDRVLAEATTTPAAPGGATP